MFISIPLFYDRILRWLKGSLIKYEQQQEYLLSIDFLCNIQICYTVLSVDISYFWIYIYIDSLTSGLKSCLLVFFVVPASFRCGDRLGGVMQNQSADHCSVMSPISVGIIV